MEERNRLENHARRVASLHSEIMNIYHEIQDEADDIGRREAALKAKETQRVQRELKAAKSGIEAVVREFEDQLTSAGADQFNPLIRKSESAITSIIEAHKPRDNYIVNRTESGSYMPQFGEQVHVKRLGDKLATVVEAPGDDETVLVQYGKIRARVKKTDVKAIPSLKKSSATSTTSPLNMQIQDEADDIGRREAALKAKVTQRVQRELKAAKSGIEAVVREFEDQLTSAGADQFNPLIRKSEFAIASIIEAHKPRTESDSYMPQFGEQVHVKRFGDKLATVVEAPGDDETVLVQYGKIRARVKKTDVKAIPSLKKSSATSTTSPLNMQVVPQSMVSYSVERLKEGAVVDAGHDDGKGEGEETEDVAPQEFVVGGKGQGVASPGVGEGGVALGEAPYSFVAPQRVEKIVKVETEASVGGSSQAGVPIPEVAKASQGTDEIKEKSVVGIKRVRVEGEDAGGDQAMKRAKAASEAASGTPEAMAVPGDTNIVLGKATPEVMAVLKVAAKASSGKATPEAMTVPNVAEVSFISQVDAIPPLDASVVVDETSKQMVIFRGCQVSASVLAFVHRLEQAVPQVFAGLILKTSGFLAMIYETVARVIKVLDQFSPYTLPAQELYFLEAALTDLEVSGVDVGWLKSALDKSRQVQSTGVARAEVERLRQVSLEAAKAYEIAKLQLDEQIQGIFGEDIEMASSYSAFLKI